jgi:lysophospholipase L1-like esterase
MGVQIMGLIALLMANVLALQMTSLGSSFAAGPGLPASKNYAHVFATKLEATLSDLSVSGSTLLSMSSQIARIPGNTDIVTVTSGGNDLGYIGGLLADSMGIGGGGGDTSLSEQQLVGRFNDALAQIHSKAPKAKVYLVEYLTILGPDVKPNSNVPFNETRVQHHRSVAATLQKATVMAAERKDWVERIPVAEASQGHGIGSAEPWVNGDRGVGAWHPNAAGMQAVADMLYERIKRKRT